VGPAIGIDPTNPQISPASSAQIIAAHGSASGRSRPAGQAPCAMSCAALSGRSIRSRDARRCAQHAGLGEAGLGRLRDVRSVRFAGLATRRRACAFLARIGLLMVQDLLLIRGGVRAARGSFDGLDWIRSGHGCLHLCWALIGNPLDCKNRAPIEGAQPGDKTPARLMSRRLCTSRMMLSSSSARMPSRCCSSWRVRRRMPSRAFSCQRATVTRCTW